LSLYKLPNIIISIVMMCRGNHSLFPLVTHGAPTLSFLALSQVETPPLCSSQNFANNAYCLKFSPQLGIHEVVHANSLKHYDPPLLKEEAPYRTP
jgi:hypothetical protein